MRINLTDDGKYNRTDELELLNSFKWKMNLKPAGSSNKENVYGYDLMKRLFRL